MLHMPAPTLLGPTGKGVGEFNAYIESLQPVLWSWTDDNPPFSPSLRIRAGSVNSSMTMTGSPYNSRYFGRAGTTGPARVVQHALPDEASFNEQIQNGGYVLIVSESAGTQNLAGLNRNGYVSADGSGFGGFRCRRILWWSFSLNAAFEADPWAASPAVPLVW